MKENEPPKRRGRQEFAEARAERGTGIELELRGVAFARQVPIGLQYKGRTVGQARLDLLVKECLVVELKAIEQIAPIYVAQTLSYLKATRVRLGLLVNFNVTTLRRGIKRIIHTP